MDRVFLYKGLLSDGECEHLISLVRPYSIHLLGIYIYVAPHVKLKQIKTCNA
ncbi:hypothetical protein Hanom_Chr10g00880871 [Helianthus anomalus]